MSITDAQVELLADKYVVELYQQLEKDVITDIARRVRNTGRLTETAELMARNMREQGYSTSKIYAEVMRQLQADPEYRRYVAKNTLEYKHTVTNEIRQTVRDARKAGDELVSEAGNMCFNNDLSMWRQAGVNLSKPSSMSQIVNAMQQNTSGELRNLTKTSGFKGTVLGTTGVMDAYQRSLDVALLKMSTGTFSYDAAVNDVVKELAKSGLRSIDYKNGRSYQLDTAARMCVRTSCSQLAGKVTEANCAATGQDLVITSQHVGSRPTHLNFENKVFSLSGKNKKYPAFSDSIEAGGAGYGEIGGIKGVNCRHDFFPFWEGISKIPAKIKQPDPVTIGGKEYSYYDATQKQRAMERDIRATKREMYCAESEEDKRILQEKLRKQSADYYKFSDAAGIKPKPNRLQVLKDSGQTESQKQVKKLEGAIVSEKQANARVRKAAKAFNRKIDTSTNDGRINAAKQLMKGLGVDTKEISFEVMDYRYRGACFGNLKNSTTCEYKRFTLQEFDERSDEYKVKTMFHESYHLSLNGKPWDGVVNGAINPVWRDVEETLAECAAHYGARQYGIRGDLSPSYAQLLVENLPRLRQLDGYSSCTKITDFGRVAWKDRMLGKGGVWGPVEKELSAISIDEQSYYGVYFNYISRNKEKVIDKILEARPGDTQRRQDMLDRLTDILDRVDQGDSFWSFTDSADKLVLYESLANAMIRKGVH